MFSHQSHCGVPLRWRSLFALAMLLLLANVQPSHGEELSESAAAKDGCDPGALVPAFYVREITGRRPNLATCLVCRFGARPVILMSVRHLDDQVTELITQVDRIVDDQRGQGLRGFAMFLTDDTRSLQPRLTTMARQQELFLPLAIPVESGGPATLKLPEDEALTVVMYHDRTIHRTLHFKSDELTDNAIAEIARLTKSFVDEVR